ncbi:putative DNA ligase [Alteromonas phage vB_AmaP_AD45-P2]|uniref:ATP-dependent DNA ligase family profile domain-containing protein n=1 Tax=Pseudorhizobium pelagicum TaxID=1509405 RepID=A0A922T8V2_9HYPH|nr:hypothetical protein [Pseudorhizobium pelagicum]YP_008126067.1 ATP-dependent DNA ligase [Alteromonas phage vB_AmaP_AD45-P1]AGM47030.1 putative DNA ligase [Alteromonas phage vB_AmaP_AD45-P3]AGM47146.1 putative DNA ligase [Alteromonas phage vB_AmaP_AD45-P4]AGM47268.1 putative DNA ligase [Alteromonas phage vB_AmaP_AD45-P2]AGM46914.1 putative DNA ligase [Alteromonas phage vB_AmaP_AD45-P1]KEQ05612.1 hypothetical protein GV68_08775 [Pseudorhizobium pelagicum]
MNPLFEQLLYKTHSSGKIGTWSVRVNDEGSHALMTVASAKIIGGQKVVTTTEYKEGKNIGRANETTFQEQAVAEARSKVMKKIDAGYTRQKPEEGTVATNGLGLIKPMLAKPIENVKKWDFPVHVQPKMDGHRMLAAIVDHKVVLYSRQGKVLDVEHIRSALQAAYDLDIWSGRTLDGEVYAHGETLQTISSWVKKPKPESLQLIYNIYDVDWTHSYKDRLEYIDSVLSNIETEYLDRTTTTLVSAQEELEELHAQHIGEGYEGTIVRHSDVGYEQGKRSGSLMKKKDFQDAEFEIIGVLEGKPNLRCNTKVGIYRCKTDTGVEFQVTAPGDVQEKNTHAVEGEQNISKYLTVKFFNLTPDGCPFHPVALRIREDV